MGESVEIIVFRGKPPAMLPDVRRWFTLPAPLPRISLLKMIRSRTKSLIAEKLDDQHSAEGLHRSSSSSA